MENKKQLAAASGGGGGGMKKSASELALEEFLNNTADAPFFADVCFADLGFKNREMMNGFISNAGLADTIIWSQLMSKQNPTISAATMDSQSSVCVGSPTSGKNSKTGKDDDPLGRSSSSDDDDLEIEEHTNDPIVLKRIRRMVSNRESARRSRRRKQAHMADLELQVDQLRGENATLFKQLTDATHQYRDADTNNRVLKSDVEALRAKVKLAEDMVARGSLSCSLNQLLQNHLAPQQHQQQHRVANVSPTVTIRRDHHVAPPGISVNNNSNGIISDTVSCVSEIWP